MHFANFCQIAHLHLAVVVAEWYQSSKNIADEHNLGLKSDSGTCYAMVEATEAVYKKRGCANATTVYYYNYYSSRRLHYTEEGRTE